MSKVLEASAEGGKVKIAGGEVPGCRILSGGAAKSNGFVILDEDLKVYIAVPMESLKEMLDLMSALAQKVGAEVAPSNSGGPIAPNLNTSMQEVVQKIKELKGNLQ